MADPPEGPPKGPPEGGEDRRDPEQVKAEAIQNTQKHKNRSLTQRPEVMTNDFHRIPVGGRLNQFTHKWTQKGSVNCTDKMFKFGP